MGMQFTDLTQTKRVQSVKCALQRFVIADDMVAAHAKAEQAEWQGAFSVPEQHL